MFSLHIDTARTWRGGQNQVLLLMRRQRGAGHEAHLAAPRDSALFERARGEGFPVHPLGSVLALARIQRALRPDVVHWHAAKAHSIGALATLLAPGPARVLSRRVVFPVRGSIGSRLLYALPIDRILAISNAVKEALVRSGVEGGKIEVVPSGIELGTPLPASERNELRRSLRTEDDDIVGITVAALDEGKGHRELLEAMARTPGPKLWIAGDGPLRSRFEAAARPLGDRVQFLGFRADISSLLRAADFFVLATRSEGLGSSVLEAMAAGLPVVATRVGGIPETVVDGRTGILVPPDDPAALANALARMAGDRGLRVEMGREGLSRAAAFSADRTAEGTERVYRELLAAR